MEIIKRLKSLGYIEIFIVISLVFLAFFVVKFFGLKKEYLTIKVEVIKDNWLDNYDSYGYRVPFWLSDKVKIGQVDKDKTGKIIATVTNVENYERGNEESELYLTLKIQVILNKRTGIYSFKSKSLNLGSEIDLTLDNIDLRGQVIDNNVSENGLKGKWFLIKARGRNYDPWVYTQIIPGVKMYNKANNDVIAEIMKVKIEDSTLQKINYDSSGQYLRSFTGNNKDAVVDLKVKAYENGDRWYFCGHQNLKIANTVYIYTEKINLYALEIEEIKELPDQK